MGNLQIIKKNKTKNSFFFKIGYIQTLGVIKQMDSVIEMMEIPYELDDPRTKYLSKTLRLPFN